MEWSALFGPEQQPTPEAIEDYISSELWHEMNDEIAARYKVAPLLSYSKCSAQPGWNVKYKKGGKALCTLYPMEGFFIALVTIGNKELNEVEQTLSSYSDYTRELFLRTPFSCGGRWLMINVTEKAILEDVLNLINVRVRAK